MKLNPNTTGTNMAMGAMAGAVMEVVSWVVGPTPPRGPGDVAAAIIADSDLRNSLRPAPRRV